MKFLEKFFRIKNVNSENTSDLLLMNRERFLVTIAENLSKINDGEKRLAHIETIRNHIEWEISMLNGIYSFLWIIFVAAGFLLQSISISTASMSDYVDTNMKIIELQEKWISNSWTVDDEKLKTALNALKWELLKIKQNESSSNLSLIRWLEWFSLFMFCSILIAYFSQITPLMFHRQALRWLMIAVVELEKK